MAKLVLETFIDVESLVEAQGDDPDVDAAFEEASTDETAAKASLPVDGPLLEGATITGAEFVEFDSSNWTHANAVWHVMLEGPRDRLEAVLRDYDADLDPDDLIEE